MKTDRTTLPRVDSTCHTDRSEPAAELRTDQAAALLPRNLLRDDETILLLIKPSPLYILLSSLGSILAVVLVALGVLWLQRNTSANWIQESSLRGLVLVLILVRIVWQMFEWYSRVYVLTDLRVIRVMGVIRQQVYQAELRQLRRLNNLYTYRERMFGLGTIAFSTNEKQIPEAYWVMISQPEQVREQIEEAIKRYGG